MSEQSMRGHAFINPEKMIILLWVYSLISLTIIITLAVQLYAVMNPLVAIPKFTEAVESEGMSHSFVSLVNRVFFVIVLLSTVFVFAGNYILTFFGISVTSLKIAGGIILLAVAIDTLITGHKPERIEAGDLIVVPIATPLIIGPGTMTSLILFSGMYGITNVLISSYIACILVYFTLLLSVAILRLLGPTFVNGLGKFMSLIIASFAIQMLLSGVSSYIEDFLSS